MWRATKQKVQPPWTPRPTYHRGLHHTSPGACGPGGPWLPAAHPGLACGDWRSCLLLSYPEAPVKTLLFGARAPPGVQLQDCVAQASWHCPPWALHRHLCPQDCCFDAFMGGGQAAFLLDRAVELHSPLECRLPAACRSHAAPFYQRQYSKLRWLLGLYRGAAKYLCGQRRGQHTEPGVHLILCRGSTALNARRQWSCVEGGTLHT